MNLEEIEKLMKLLENSTLSYLEIEENGIKIKLDKNSGVREVSKPNVEETTSSLPKEVVNAPVGKEIPREYIQEDEMKNAPKIFEKIDKFSDWLNE